jgi:hypothetical protein
MKKYFSRIVTFWTAISLVCLMFPQSPHVLAANFDSLTAYGVDTIAGYSSLLQTTKTYPNMDVILSVKKPDGSKVLIPAKTDASGVAKIDLYDYHTRRAGTYFVSANFKNSTEAGQVTTFTVYPDEVSSDNSSITASRSIAKTDGKDQVYLSVGLRDQYGNPFVGHVVNVISSRSGDTITAPATNSVTDQNGTVTFTVSASDTGVSIYSAVDVTSGVILSGRAQIAFMSSSSSMVDAGGGLGSFIPVAEAATAGSLHHFTFSDIPSSIVPNNNVNFRVTAQDLNNLTVDNYTGTVHFSAEGSNSSNVNLPEDYTFKAEDLGTHLFSLGLSFTTNGTYKIDVTDTANTLMKGVQTVVVGTGGGGTEESTGTKPSITTPSAGSYSNATQTISGNAPSGKTINIFDNSEQIGSVQANSGGVFTFQTSPLSDGKHKIYVVSLAADKSVDGTSDTVEITIDTNPPTVDQIDVTPSSGITPGTVLSVKVMSEENIKQAAVVFNTEIVELTADLTQTGVYTASLQAPAAPGDYPIDVTLVDQLDNEATYKAKATVTVSASGGSVSTQQTQISSTQETQPTSTETQQTEVILPENLPPTQVFGVVAYGSDKRVTLVWEAATDSGSIDHYRINYGVDPASLDKTVDTKDASVTWYIPGLENGKEYYFAVAAVDDTGLESTTKSDLVSAIPFTLEVTTALPATPTVPLATTGGTPLLHGASVEQMPPNPGSGPELLWLVVGSGVFSGFSRKVFRKSRRNR